MAKPIRPKEHRITITVDNDGDFTYENPLIWAYQGDSIVWECKNDCPFSIHIGWNSPLDKGRYHSVNGDTKKAKKAEVKEDAQPGKYSYTVAVYLNGEIWTDDPPFIVKPPPKGG